MKDNRKSASEMIETAYLEIGKPTPEIIKKFQRQKRPETQGAYFDEPAFSNWVKELEEILGSRVYRPTAKRILNNMYLYALELKQLRAK